MLFVGSGESSGRPWRPRPRLRQKHKRTRRVSRRIRPRLFHVLVRSVYSYKMECLDVASWEALSYICAIYVVVQHSALGVDGGVFF